MATYRIGIIGFGKIAHDQHVPAIAGDPAFDLIAVSNGTGDAPQGARAFETYQEMLEAVPELDAVAICTPPGPRRLIAAACLDAGKHILLEKPPAGTVAEVGNIAYRAKAAGKVAFATYHAQHNGAVKRAAEVLRGKMVKRLEVTWKEDIRRWHPGEEWILAAGGFGVFDPGINALSILTAISPEPVFIRSATLHVPANRQAPIAAELTFATGLREDETLTAVLDWRQTGEQIWRIDVETVDGVTLSLSDGGARLAIPGAPDFIGPPDEYPDIYRTFAKLLSGARSEVDAVPFQLVADAFMLGSRSAVDPFTF
jgi:D-galactose 1-dehydrogenase